MKQLAGKMDSATIGELYDQHGEALYRYALAVLLSDHEAADAVHTVFAALVERRLHSNAEILEIRNYLFRAVRNEIYRIARRRRKDRPPAGLIFEPETPGDRGQQLRVQEGLAALPPEQREAVILKIYHDMTFQEIAEFTGENPDAAASRYRYGIDKLKRILKDRDA